MLHVQIGQERHQLGSVTGKDLNSCYSLCYTYLVIVLLISSKLVSAVF
jgi:hypothetical protein